MTTLYIEQLRIGYGQQLLTQAINLSLQSGSLLAVIGSNGSGKSTFLKTLCGELRPLQGSMRLEQCSKKDIAYLPQRHYIDPRFPIDVQDFVAMGLWRYIGAFTSISRNLRSQIQDALKKVGLQSQQHQPLAKLSGGQLQRALFARLLLQDARIILLDEPFNAIDKETSADLLALLKEWQQQGRIVICVLHDWQQVSHFPETLWLHPQHVIHGPTTQVLHHHSKHHSPAIAA